MTAANDRRRRHLAEVVALMRDPATLAAVAANKATDPYVPQPARRPWTPADVYHVGTVIDTWGRITVALRRPGGCLVEQVKVPASDPDPAAAALREANGRA